MELYSCPHHISSYCFLKTGIKPGPTQGTSFYVCGHCQLSTHTKLPPLHCSVHKSHTVELQSIVNEKNNLRRYFRCPGRSAGESWCGHESFPKQAVKILNEHQVKNSGTSERRVKNSGTSDVKESQYKSQNCKEYSKVDTIVKPSGDNKICTSYPIITDQTSNVKSESSVISENRSVIMSDNEDDHKKQVLVKEKTNESMMEISFANLSKSRLVPDTSSSEMNISFANKSFKQYRDSPQPPGKSKLGQSSLKPLIIDSEDSSESDLDESHGARKELENLKISNKPDISKPEICTATYKSNIQKLSSKVESSGKGKEMSSDETFKSEIISETNTRCSKPVTSQANHIKDNSKCSISKDNDICQEISQKKTTITAQPLTAESSAVKPKFYSAECLRSLIGRKEQLIIELQKLQSSLRFINVNTLPDKGQRILDKTKAMQNSIRDIDNEIKKARSQLSQPINSSSTTGSTKSEAQVSDPCIKERNNQNPVQGSSQIVNSSKTYNTNCNNNAGSEILLSQSQRPQLVQEFAHLPQHLQQLFASNPQAMTLYGGRMTAQRLREVGSITTEAIDKLHKQLESCPTELTEYPDPQGLKLTLKSHQRHALAWLAWREKQVPPGGILADDMGLGKTLTTISHILRHKAARAEEVKDEWLNRDKQVEKLKKSVKKSGATLIVAPASLVHQWAKEIERRCRPGLLKFHVYHGPSRERNIQKLIDNDIVLTTYTIVSKEVGLDKSENAENPAQDQETGEEPEIPNNEKPEELSLLLKIGWERIVLDEAHNIKNHKSLTAQSVCRLRAVYRWALTGTPIQNDLLDMYSLLRFLRFSPFDEFKVWKKHVDSGKGDTKRLNTIVKALLLRRTKDQTNFEGKPLVSLPSKTSQTIQVELTSEERTVYDRWFRKTQSTVQEYVQRHADKEFESVGGMEPKAITHKDDFRSQDHGGVTAHGINPNVNAVNKVVLNQGRSTGSRILVLLLRLRQCCSHLSLLKSDLDAASVESEGIELTLEEQMKGMLLENIDRDISGTNSLKSSLFDKSSLSTKLKCVMEKVSSIKNGGDSGSIDKCIIVSQWTQMLEVVSLHLDKAGILYRIIKGDIPAKKRMDIVDDFNTNTKGAQVLLLSLQAGGVGLNLVGGNHLFLLDIHWNPALEEQACDRIYRMGQKKNVFIYRFLCKDTIEEKIVALQDRKRSLAKSVLSGMGASNQKLSLSDLRMLFGV